MKTRLSLTSMLLIAVLLAACQAANNPPPKETVETVIIEITATPVPPTPIPPTPTPAREGKVRYWAFYGGGPDWAWNQANIANYQDQNPDLEIEHKGLSLYSSPVPSAAYQILESSNPNDVYSGFIVGNLRTYVEAGNIADISDLWEAEGWNEVFPESLKKLVTIDGKQYFVPMAIQWNPIWYRTDIFADLGLAPPETWEEMLTTCDTLHAAGLIPVAVSVTDWAPPMARWFSILNLRLNGAAFHEGLMRGEERYDDLRVRVVFEHWAEMIEHNCFSEDFTTYGNAANQILNGEAAMYNLGEWLSESYPDGMPDTFDFFAFPILNPEVDQGEIIHVYGAYMWEEARNPVEARALLAYLGSAASQTSIGETLNRLAAHGGVDPNIYSAVYQRGLTFVADAENMTQLFEFNTDRVVAGNGLPLFEQFLRDPSTLDTVIAELERLRLLAYGAP